MKVFSIIGWSGSGKTALITRLIESFRGKNRTVVAVKSTHAGYALQPEGKDTARFLRAGAQEVYLVSGAELLRMTRLDSPDALLSDLEARLGPDDIVLLEGLSRPGIPVIEVEDPLKRRPLKASREELAAVVGVPGGAGDGPRFHPDDVGAIGAFMEAYHEK